MLPRSSTITPAPGPVTMAPSARSWNLAAPLAGQPENRDARIMSPEPPDPTIATQSPPGPDAPRRRQRRIRAAVLVALGVLATLAALARLADRPARRQAREAREAIASGRPAEALSQVDLWLRERPDSAEAHFLRGEALFHLERYAESLDALDRARQLGDSEDRVERLAGIILMRVGKRKEAEPLLRRAHERRSGPDPQLDEAMARLDLESYRLRPALEALERWAKAEPDNPRPYLWMAEAHSRLDAPEALIADYRAALRRDPDLDDARLQLAQALHAHGRFDEAAAEFQAYLDRHPDDPVGLAGAGRVARASGRDDQAIALFDQALTLDPKNEVALENRAALALQRGQYADALPLLERAQALDPSNPEIRYRLSLALDRLGRPDDARLERQAADRLRREVAAMDQIRKDLIASPRDPDLMYRAARWLYDHGHPDEALSWARRAVELPAGHAPSARLLADHYARHGDPGLANFYRLQADRANSP